LEEDVVLGGEVFASTVGIAGDLVYASSYSIDHREMWMSVVTNGKTTSIHYVMDGRG
jgi:hypothetical protein